MLFHVYKALEGFHMKDLIKTSVGIPQLLSLEELVNILISIYHPSSGTSELMTRQSPEEKSKE